jgi:hypothetical protein
MRTPITWSGYSPGFLVGRSERTVSLEVFWQGSVMDADAEITELTWEAHSVITFILASILHTS